MLSLPLIFLILITSIYTANAHLRPPLEFPASLVLASVAATHLCLLAFARATCRRTATNLHQPTLSATTTLNRHDRTLSILRWSIALLAAGQLWLGGWGALIMNPPTATSPGWNLARLYPYLVPQAVILAVPLFTWIGIWFFEYRVDAANFSRTYPYLLAQGIPAHAPPPLPQYLLLKIRHTFFPLVPIGLATLLAGLAELNHDAHPWLDWLSTLGPIVILLLLMPWLLTRLWATTPMSGPLRARLENSAAQHRIPFSNILIWQTHFAVKNAAIVGYLPFARYFLMTDSLLESLTDNQIESVFAHELGHARRRHIWLLLLTFASASLAAFSLSAFASLLITHLPAWTHLDPSDVFSFIQLLLVGALIFLCLGPVSRRFEHEADLFAAQHMSGHSLDPYPNPPGDTGLHFASSDPNLPTLFFGVELFSSALLRLVALTNRDPDHGNWTHPSPNRRVAFLRSIASDPATLPDHARHARNTRLLIFLFAVISAGLFTAALLFTKFDVIL